MHLDRYRNWFLPVGLFLLFLAASPGRILAFDVGIRQEIAHALWTRGSVFVPAGSPFDAGLVLLTGNPGGTSFYGMGQSLAFVPFDILGSALVAVSGATGSVGNNLRALPLVFLYAPLLGVAWWWAMSLLLQAMGWHRDTARPLAAVFSLSTILFVYSTQTLQEESLVGCAAVLSLVAWMRGLKTGARLPCFVAGALAGFCLLTRLNSFWIALPLLGATLDTVRTQPRQTLRAIAAAVFGVTLPLALLMGFAAWRYGSPFATGYDAAAARGLGVFWTHFQPEIFWGLWAGPGKGLLILSPFLIFGFWGWRTAWKDHVFLGWSTAAALLGSITLCAFIYNNPDGSESWGARYQVHLIGFFVHPVLVGYQKARKTFPYIAMGILLLSVIPQWASLLAPDAYEYTQNDREGLPRSEIITGIAHGQLGRRLANLPGWFSRHTPEDLELAQIRRNFVPNLWGITWGRKLSSPRAAWLIWYTWLGILVAALACLRASPMRRLSNETSR